MGRGGGNTPEMVVTLLKKKVAETSQAAVSRETGLGLATINDYLKGKGEPTSKTLQKLADYFGVSVSVLRGEGLAYDTDYSLAYDTDYYDATICQQLLATDSLKGFAPKKIFFDATGLKFNDDVSPFEKYAFFTLVGFKMAFNDKDTYCSGDIHYLHRMAEKAKDLLKLPESFHRNINPGVWETLKHNAQKIIEKYYKALETADDETKAFFSEEEFWGILNSNFYDLATTPDYFTRLTATFDSILSLALKTKLTQPDGMFLAVAVSLAKLIRDIPSKLSNIYDHEYMQDLQKLARSVIKEIDSEHLMEDWAPPSITPKLKQQPVEESSQEHKPKPKASNKKAKP